MEQTVIQVGNSLGLIIPSSMRNHMGVRKGSKVVMEQTPNGGVHIVGKSFQKKPLKANKAFQKWLDSVVREDAEILDELAVR